MKKLWAVLLVALPVVLFLCNSHGQTPTVRSYVEDGLVNEEQIIRDIEVPLSNMATGIIERDAELIFSIFSDPVKARYIRNGAIYDTISSAEEIYARRFAKQDQSVTRLFEFKSKEFDIISPGTVLFTGIGVLDSEGSTSEQEPQVIAYTIVWILESDGWKAINMHISWE